jgi:hypothetical protein
VIVQYVVTRARSRFESLAIKDIDLTTDVTDELLLLQLARSDGDATSAYPEHVGEVFLREMEMISMRAVMRHQQPARQARFNGNGYKQRFATIASPIHTDSG